MTRPAPPTGATPPAQVLTAEGVAIELRPLAREICRRYHQEFTDEEERYGPAGREWCLHDNQYLLAWAIQDARDGTVRLDEQAVWLAGVLEARNFPAARLARDLEIAGDVVLTSHVLGALAKPTSEIFADAAAAVSALRQIP